VAGELARHYDILPWPENAALEACQTLFNHWKEQLKASGAETPEAKICSMVATFISRYGDARFSDVTENNPDERWVHDRAGWWEQIVGGPRIYLFTSDALQDACKGHDIKEISAALKAAGALQKISADGKHLALVTALPSGNQKRLYYVHPGALEK